MIESLCMVLLAYLLGALYQGLYRILNAKVHKRVGPKIVQSLIDTLKLFTKETTIFNYMFFLGPAIMLTSAILTVISVPFASFEGISKELNIFFTLYMMLVGALGNALAISSSGNPFANMSITRGLTRLMALELPFFIAVIALVVTNHSMDINVIIAHQEESINATTYPLLALGALIAFQGMMNKSPFDVVVAPQELYSGVASEFSGRLLAMMMMSNALFSFAKLVLVVDLFFGGASSIAELLMKVTLLFLIITLLGAIYTRMRFDNVVDFLLKVPVVLALIGLILALY
jgi:NADH-quinone oxidoreductase subunit H